MGEDLEIRLKKEDIKRIFNPKTLILLFFILTAIWYLNINKLPLTHPGNIKAADPFYHATLTENILDTKQWNFIDLPYSLGVESVINPQPPLFYINAAILSDFTGLPAWASIYFLVALSQAFFVIIIYLLTKEIFGNEHIALLAGAFSILPHPINVWLYGLYIGLWIQVPAYFFIMAFFWLFVIYLKKEENWVLFVISLCITSVLLVHSPDLIVMFIGSLVLGIKFLLDFIKTKDLKFLIKKGLLVGLIPLILFGVFAPRFLNVWNQKGQNMYTPGYYGFNRDIYSMPNHATIFPQTSAVPGFVYTLFIVGMIVLAIQIIKPFDLKLKFKKKVSLVLSLNKNNSKTIWFFVVLHFLFLIYYSMAFFNAPYYLARARALQVFFLYPIVAYIIYLLLEILVFVLSSIPSLFKYIKKNTETIRLVLIILISFLVVKTSYPTYTLLVNQLNYEHLSIDEWNAYKWMHNNVKESEKVFFFGGTFQAENVYSKRIHVILDTKSMTEHVVKYVTTNQTPLNFKVDWGGSTVRTYVRVNEKGKYEMFPKPNKNVSILDFDYVFFQNLNMPILEGVTMGQANQVLAQEYIEKYGFIVVYNQQGYVILKNEK